MGEPNFCSLDIFHATAAQYKPRVAEPISFTLLQTLCVCASWVFHQDFKVVVGTITAALLPIFPMYVVGMVAYFFSTQNSSKSISEMHQYFA